MNAVSIRPGVMDDLAALTALYNHYVATSHATFDLRPATLDERREWFSHYAPSGPHRLLVAIDGDRLLGYACSSKLRPKPAYATSVETSVYVEPMAQGRGVGAQLYRALFAALAGEDVHRAFAGIALPNPASVALHRRFGFTDLGVFDEVGRKFDRYWSVQWFVRAMP